MKLVWHMPTLRRTTCGLSIRAIELARRLRKAGHVITFVVDRDKTDISQDHIDGMPLRRIAVAKQRPVHWSLQSRIRAAAATAIARQITFERDLEHDLLISCQPEVVAACARAPDHQPLLYVCGGTTLLHEEAERMEQKALSVVRQMPYLLDRRLKRRQEISAFAAADAVVFDSHHTREAVIAAYGVDAGRCWTVHGGVDSERFRPPTEDERQVARQRLGISANGIALVWTGRLSPEKNLELLLNALPECRAPVERVLVVGDGPAREELPALARRVGLRVVEGDGSVPFGDGPGPVVQFTGEQSDVRPFLRAADVFVFPSRGESFGGAMIEAMACGLTCVALRPDGRLVRNAASEIVEHSRTGLLVNEPSPRALAESLDLLAFDDEQRRRMGQAGRRRACEHFTWDSGAKRLGDLISKLVRVPVHSDIQVEG
jgi:glycosyltransferase involved in cell wall biosynthesis